MLWRCYDTLHVFLDRYAYCLDKWKLLATIYEGVNRGTCARLEKWHFYAKTIAKSCDLLSRWLGKHTNLRLVILILILHPFASPIMPLMCVKFAIILTMIALLIPIIFLMTALLGLVV